METTEAQFKKVDILPVVKYYMDQLGIYDLFNESWISLFVFGNFSFRQPVLG
jgi:hypothetical protein